MNVLAIESSCDETAVAIYSDRGLLANVVYSQIDLHAEYGGVVPELASRDHLRKILPVLEQALQQADLTSADIDAIGYTNGPGLIGALMIGATVAKSLALAWGVPSIAVHHLEAHLMAVMLEDRQPTFPFLGLLISGGHTLLIEAKAFGQYEVLGQTLDDAVGEAFDKTAKLLGLPYPGGPMLAKLAEQGNADVYQLTRPMINRPGLDFSFSGLKTQVLSLSKQVDDLDAAKADIAASFQKTVVETLCLKTKRAIEQSGATQLVVAGGVSANKALRQALEQMCAQINVNLFVPALAYCTDNAAMIAVTAYWQLQRGDSDVDRAIAPKARWALPACCQ